MAEKMERPDHPTLEPHFRESRIASIHAISTTAAGTSPTAPHRRVFGKAIYSTSLSSLLIRQVASHSERPLLSLPPLHEGLVASDQITCPTLLLVSAPRSPYPEPLSLCQLRLVAEGIVRHKACPAHSGVLRKSQFSHSSGPRRRGITQVQGGMRYLPPLKNTVTEGHQTLVDCTGSIWSGRMFLLEHNGMRYRVLQNSLNWRS
jgi:hypothetical protein